MHFVFAFPQNVVLHVTKQLIALSRPLRFPSAFSVILALSTLTESSSRMHTDRMVVAVPSLARILRKGSTIHSPPALFFSCLFVKWRSARVGQFHCLAQDQSTVAQRAEKAVTENS